MILSTTNIIKKYSGTKGRPEFVLDIDGFNLEEGSVFTLLGPNGSGKTTFIKSILNLVFLDSGQIQLFGIEHFLKESRRHVGYLPEDFTFLTNYRFKDVAFWYGTLLRDRKIDIRKNVLSICEELCLTELLDKRIWELSKGMLQSLGLIISLLGDKRFLILDEPLNGLDPIQRRNTAEYLLRLNKTLNVTILLTTHILSDAQSLSTQIGLLKRGKIVANDSSANIVNSYGSLEHFYLKFLQS
jgi:ABC-2 type transport system ATP-binding protein